MSALIAKVGNSMAARVVAAVVLLLLLPRLFGSKKKVNLQGKTVLVTGAAGGIGGGMCKAFASRGCRLVLWDINRKALDEMIAKLPSGCVAESQIVDVSNAEDVEAAAQRTLADTGSIDVLVGNAGILGGRPLIQTTTDRIRRVIEVNVLSLFWVTKAFLPDMIEKKRGHVVTIASGAALTGVPDSMDYSASKHAAHGFSDSLRLELRKYKNSFIRTTCIFPGVVDTPMAAGYRLPGIPALDADWMGERIVKAVEYDEAHVYTPWTTGLAPLARGLTPISVGDWVSGVFGVDQIANNWDSKHTDVVHDLVAGSKK